jgi:hypothetical protein
VPEDQNELKRVLADQEVTEAEEVKGIESE